MIRAAPLAHPVKLSDCHAFACSVAWFGHGLLPATAVYSSTVRPGHRNAVTPLSHAVIDYSVVFILVTRAPDEARVSHNRVFTVGGRWTAAATGRFVFVTSHAAGT